MQESGEERIGRFVGAAKKRFDLERSFTGGLNSVELKKSPGEE